MPGVGLEVTSALPGDKSVIAPVYLGCPLKVGLIEFMKLAFKALIYCPEFHRKGGSLIRVIA
jgi:hypothetical protein